MGAESGSTSGFLGREGAESLSCTHPLGHSRGDAGGGAARGRRFGAARRVGAGEGGVSEQWARELLRGPARKDGGLLGHAGWMCGSPVIRARSGADLRSWRQRGRRFGAARRAAISGGGDATCVTRKTPPLCASCCGAGRWYCRATHAGGEGEGQAGADGADENARATNPCTPVRGGNTHGSVSLRDVSSGVQQRAQRPARYEEPGGP